MQRTGKCKTKRPMCPISSRLFIKSSGAHDQSAGLPVIRRIFLAHLSTLCLKTGIRLPVKKKKERKKANDFIVGLFWVAR